MAQTGEIVRMESANRALRDAFLRWQCRVRQMLMREAQGRPGDAIMPALTLAGAAEPMGHIITVMSKAPQFSKTPELRQMLRKTQDPAARREAALGYLAETYFQRAAEFSDILTATFPPGSPGAAAIRAAGRATLRFDAYSQRFELDCKVWELAEHNPLWQATYWHNALFNPNLPAETVILGFEPDWSRSAADPSPV